MRTIISILIALFSLGANAQTAKQVLDKTASLYSKSAVQVGFTTNGNSGTLVAQGNKFTLQSAQATIWFDGKTEWSLVKGSNEVNIVEPTAKEIATMNPMNFVSLYKSGYKQEVKTVGTNYEVHLTATANSKAIKEMYITIDKASYRPKTVKMRTNSKNWTTISVTSFTQTAKKADSYFKFNRASYPKARIIDLR